MATVTLKIARAKSDNMDASCGIPAAALLVPTIHHR
jgi:hypothetical protein